MRKARVLLAGMLVGAVSAASAGAAVVTHELVDQGTHVFDDQTYQVFDIVATTTSDWTASEMRADLTFGSFLRPEDVRPELSGNDRFRPNSGLWEFVPDLEFATYVASPPDFNDPGIAGRNPTTDGEGPAILTEDAFSVAWFEDELPLEKGPQTFTMARFVVTEGAIGTAIGQSFTEAGGAVGTPFAIVIPEPAGLGLVGIAALGLMHCRRRGASGETALKPAGG